MGHGLDLCLKTNQMEKFSGSSLANMAAYLPEYRIPPITAGSPGSVGGAESAKHLFSVRINPLGLGDHMLSQKRSVDVYQFAGGNQALAPKSARPAAHSAPVTSFCPFAMVRFRPSPRSFFILKTRRLLMLRPAQIFVWFVLRRALSHELLASDNIW